MKVCKCKKPTIDIDRKHCSVCGITLNIKDMGYNPFPWIEDGKLYSVTSSGETK